MSGMAGFAGAEVKRAAGDSPRGMPPSSTLKYMRAMGVEAFWETLGCRCQKIGGTSGIGGVSPSPYSTTITTTTRFTVSSWGWPSSIPQFNTSEEYVVDATARKDLWPEPKDFYDFARQWNFALDVYGSQPPTLGGLTFEWVIFVRNVV